MFHQKIVCFSQALNFVLRFAWIQQVTHWQIKHVEHNGIDLFFAALEVIRRGHWNFYRCVFRPSHYVVTNSRICLV